MAKDAGGLIVGLGLVGLGYVLYKRGAFNNIIAKGGGVGVPTPNANPRTPGVPVPNINFAPQFSGLQNGSSFGLVGVTLNEQTPGGSMIDIFEPAPNNLPAGTELPGED